MDRFIASDIPNMLERKDQARDANKRIADFWDRPINPPEINRVINEKIVPLSKNTQVYLYNLLVAGRHIGMSAENIRAQFMRDPDILKYWIDNQEVDLYNLFDVVDRECLDSGIVSEGYTTYWDVNLDTGEIYNKNDPQHRPEPGRRFTLPADYKTVEFLFTPELEPSDTEV